MKNYLKLNFWILPAVLCLFTTTAQAQCEKTQTFNTSGNQGVEKNDDGFQSSANRVGYWTTGTTNNVEQHWASRRYRIQHSNFKNERIENIKFHVTMSPGTQNGATIAAGYITKDQTCDNGQGWGPNQNAAFYQDLYNCINPTTGNPGRGNLGQFNVNSNNQTIDITMSDFSLLEDDSEEIIFLLTYGSPWDGYATVSGVTAEITYLAEPEPDFSADNTTIAEGGSVTFSDETGPVQGQCVSSRSWSFPGSASSSTTSGENPVVTYNNTGQFTVELSATNAQGTETETKTNYITVVSQLTADAGSDLSVCPEGQTQIGGMPTAQDGIPPYTYEWEASNGSTVSPTNTANPTATLGQGISTATYTVTVTDNQGNTSTSSMNLTAYATPTADAGPDVNICPGGSVQIGGNPTGDGTVGPYSFSWSPSSSLSSSSASNPVASPGQNQTYTVVVTDDNGCTGSDQVLVSLFSPPTVNAGNDVIHCFGTPANLGGWPNDPTASGNGPFSYSWTPTNGLNDPTIANPISNISSPIPMPNVYTNYTVVVTDDNGCTNSDQVLITTHKLTISANPDLNACAQDDPVLGYTVDYGAGPYTNIWSPAANLNNYTLAAPTVQNITSSTTFSVTVTDGVGCTDTETQHIDVYNPPSVSLIGTNNAICPEFCNGQIELSVVSAPLQLSYAWSSPSPSAAPLSLGVCTGTYSVTVSYDILPHCNATVSNIFVDADDMPLPTYVTSNSLCSEGNCTGTIDLTTVNGTYDPYNFDWSNGAQTEDLNSICSGLYTVTTTSDAYGCTKTQTINVDADFDVDLLDQILNEACELQNNGQISLTAVGGGSATYDFNWQGLSNAFGVTSDMKEDLSPGNYLVTATDGLGCEAYGNYTITPGPAPRWPQSSYRASSGATAGDFGNDLAIDQDENVFVVGDFFGYSDFGTDALFHSGSGNGMFLTRFSECGDVLWSSHTYTQTGNAYGKAVVLDEQNGFVYVAGEINSGPCQFIAQNTSILVTGTGLFLAQYDLNGNLNWVQTGYSSLTNPTPKAMALDQNDDLVIVGGHGASQNQVFLIQINHIVPTTVIQTQIGAGAVGDVINDVEVDASGMAYLMGTFHTGTLIFSTAFPTTTSASDAFVIRYNLSSQSANGFRTAGAAGGPATGEDLVLDQSGNIYATGSFSYGLANYFNSGANLVTAGPNSYIARLNGSSFNGAWIKKFDELTVPMAYASGTAIDIWDQTLFVGGNYKGAGVAIQGATQTLSAVGSGAGNDFYVLQMDVNGNAQQLNSGQSSGTNDLRDIAASATRSFQTGAYQTSLSLPPNTVLNNGSGVSNAFVSRTYAGTNFFKTDVEETASESLEEGSIQVVPNPNSGQFQLTYTSKGFDPADVQVINSVGQVIESFQIQGTGGLPMPKSLDLSHHPKGVYLIRIVDGNDAEVERVIIK